MNQPSQGRDPRSDATLLQPGEDFMLRARRVQAHSLFTNQDHLKLWAGGGLVARREQGRETLSMYLPDEERLESLAARVRPLILEGDHVHYGTVLKALSAYLHRYGELRDANWCRTLRKDWQAVDHGTSPGGPYMVTNYSGKATAASNAELTGSWFYGDLVHADPEKIAASADFDIRDRFQAAMAHIGQLAILTQETYLFIKALRNDAVLALSPAVMTAPVNVAAPEATTVEFLTAPIDTEMPDGLDVPRRIEVEQRHTHRRRRPMEHHHPLGVQPEE